MWNTFCCTVNSTDSCLSIGGTGISLSFSSSSSSSSSSRSLSTSWEPGRWGSAKATGTLARAGGPGQRLWLGGPSSLTKQVSSLLDGELMLSMPLSRLGTFSPSRGPGASRNRQREASPSGSWGTGGCGGGCSNMAGSVGPGLGPGAGLSEATITGSLSNFSISEDTAAELGLASALGARPLATRGSAGSGRDGGGGMGSGGGGIRGICR